ncbi:flagellar hook-length control protein FliK [Oceanobacillus sp. CAU 1775]
MNVMTMLSPSLKVSSSTHSENLSAGKLMDKTAFPTVFGQLTNSSSQKMEVIDEAVLVEEVIIELNAEEMKELFNSLDLSTLKDVLNGLLEQGELSNEDLILVEEMLADLSSETLPAFDMVSEDLMAMMMKQYEEIRLAAQDSQDNTKDYQSIFQTALHLHSNLALTGLTDKQAQDQLKQLYTRIEALLQQINSQADMKKIAPKLQEFLQEWQQLTAKSSAQTSNQVLLNADNKALANVWQELVQAYEKRMGMSQRQQYNLDAKVSTNDIVRWLGNAMEANAQTDKVVQMPVSTMNMPISKVEQFVIHLNQTQTHQSVDKQLIEQFQKIMDANKITSLQNNRGQLAITLKPVNLGEMLVRFTQVNGEMVVKITVTTAAAKSMLEGNLQQLRGMFSPQQVIIERQEVNLTQTQEAQNEETREEQQDRNQEQQTNSKNEQQLEDDSFANIFEELVLNEKV